MADDSNFPGFDYLERVGKAWGAAIVGHGAALNQAWSSIKQGNYGCNQMMATWASTVESYFQTVVEASRGPGYIRQSAWTFFDCNAKPDVLKATVPLARAEPGQPQVIEFASMEGNGAISEGHARCTFVGDNRTQLQIELLPDAQGPVFKDRAGHNAKGMYIGFVVPEGRTSEAPLVIVMLRV